VCEHFVECVAERRTPLSDGRAGIRVVEVLEGMTKSLAANGETVPLQTGAST